MHRPITCPDCGLQFELTSSRRCPACNARIANPASDTGRTGTSRNEDQYAAFDRLSPGANLGTLGSGWLKGIGAGFIAMICFPLTLTLGVMLIMLGGVFDVAELMTVGGVLIGVAVLLFLFFLWRLWSGLRGALKLWRGVNIQVHTTDRWGGGRGPLDR